MNKIKITILALGVCFLISDLAAQDTKPSSSKETEINSKDLAAKKAKTDSKELAAALKIVEPLRLNEISKVLTNHELSLSKLNDQKALEIKNLERTRDKELSAILDEAEMKFYAKWKESKKAADEKMLNRKPKELIDKKSKAPVKK
ncbi:MAG: hypothetical protein QNL21_08045 [Flavobacteriales bacterium]